MEMDEVNKCNNILKKKRKGNCQMRTPRLDHVIMAAHNTVGEETY